MLLRGYIAIFASTVFLECKSYDYIAKRIFQANVNKFFVQFILLAPIVVSNSDIGHVFLNYFLTYQLVWFFVFIEFDYGLLVIDGIAVGKHDQIQHIVMPH